MRKTRIDEENRVIAVLDPIYVFDGYTMIDSIPTEEEFGYHDLRWNGVSFYEAATPEEINEHQVLKYTELVQEKVIEYRFKAKGLAISKKGTNAYISAQVDMYQRKYENAITQNPIEEIDEDLANEGMRDFGMNLIDFKQLIIQMYQIGKERENLLMTFIEQCRSAILTLISNSEWNKVEQAFIIINNMKTVESVEEARIIKNQILDL